MWNLVSWAAWRQGSEPSCNWRWIHCPVCFHLQARQSVNSPSAPVDGHVVTLSTLRLLRIKKGPMEGPEDFWRTLLEGSTLAFQWPLRNGRCSHCHCPSPADRDRKVGAPLWMWLHRAAERGSGRIFLETWHLIVAHYWMDQSIIGHGSVP